MADEIDLALMNVLFRVQGVDAAMGQIEAMGKGLSVLADAVIPGVGQALDQITSGLTSFIRAGLQGTAQMQALNNIFDRLSQEIASTFLPLIELIGDIWIDITKEVGKFGDAVQPILQKVADAMRKVWDAIEPAIGPTLEALTPFLEIFGDIAQVVGDTLAPIIKDLAAVFIENREALRELGKEFRDILKPILELWMMIQGPLWTALFGILKILVIIQTTFMNTIVAMIKGIRELFGITAEEGEKTAKRFVSAAGGGFEDVAAAYNRVAQASIEQTGALGKTVADRQLEEAEKQTGLLNQIAGNTGDYEGAVVEYGN